MAEILLSGGRTTAGAVRIGDTVRRPLEPHATFIHGLLNHLEARGFDGAPRFMGIDRAGRETLSFVSGTVPAELGAFSAGQIAAAARLLRRLHDATVDSPLRDEDEVVCHGDATGVRAWANACRAWVEQYREALTSSIAASAET